MIVYIVLNLSKECNLYPYIESCKTFLDEAKAVKQFNEWIGEPGFFGAATKAPPIGSKLIHWSGDIKVELFTTRITE